MGTNDILTNSYMSVNERFADAINVGIFKGKQVILPEQIQEIDSSAIL